MYGTDQEQQWLTKLAAIAELIHGRNEESTRRMEQTANRIGRHADQLAGSSDQFAREVVDAVGAQSQQVIAQGAAKALAGFQQQLLEATEQTRRLGAALDAQRARSRLWATAALGCLTLGALLAAGGSIYVVHDRLRALDDVNFGEEIHAATRSGALNRCGDRLCVRVPGKPVRFAGNPEYVIVE